MFVLVLSRAQVDLERPSFGLGRNRTVISLSPLDAGPMGVLLEGLVPGLPPSAAQTIAAQAEGLPLFAVETVRSLVDRGVLFPDASNAYEIAGELGALVSARQPARAVRRQVGLVGPAHPLARR